MKDLNKMSFEELKKEIETLEKQKENATVSKKGVWQIGKNYVIRTVTMINVGRLVEVTDQELVLEDCAWVAETDRWTQFLENGSVKECEPFPDPVIVGRGSIIDATLWRGQLLRTQK